MAKKRDFETHMTRLEAKQRRADKVLAAAYERANVTEPRHNGHTFFQVAMDVDSPDEGEAEDEWAQKLKWWRSFVRFIFAFGPHPHRATKRLYGIAWAVDRKRSLLGMNIREVSDLIGETRAAGSLRVNGDYSDYLALWEMRGTRVDGQKGEHTRETFRRLAKGNTARKCGRKKGESKK